MNNITKLKLLVRLFGAKRRNEYWEVLNDYINNDNVIWFQKWGTNNMEKAYALISIGSEEFDNINAEHIGFFALLNMYTLQILDVAERLNLVPYVIWGNTVPFYDDNKCERGEKNAFTQYFEQLSKIELEELKKCNKVCTSYKMAKNLSNYKSGYTCENEKIERYAYLYSKYIKVKKDVEQGMLNEISSKNIDKKTLGVHIRGIEWGNLENHPIPIRIENYFKEIDRIIINNNYEQIFLATDSEDTLKIFYEHYKEYKVCCFDVSRAAEGSKQLVIFNEEKKEEINGKYNLGKQVLLDMFALSYCDGLVAGLSNVSFTARYVKKSRGENYKDEIIIDNGIVTSGKTIQKCVREQRNMN